MLRPITRLEQYLAKIAGVSNTAPQPVTRLERYLAKMAGVNSVVPTPVTRLEQFLNIIAENGGGGGGSDIYTNTVTLDEDSGSFGINNPRGTTLPRVMVITAPVDENATYAAFTILGGMTSFLPRFFTGTTGTGGANKRFTSVVRYVNSSLQIRDATSASSSGSQGGYSGDGEVLLMPSYGSDSKYVAGLPYTITLFY